MTADLDRLRKAFDASRSRWIAEGHEGQWAAIGPDEVLLGFYDDYQAAYLAASGRFGPTGTFLLQEVLPQDRLEQIQLLSW